jgi:hypothetical protein
MKEHPTLYRLEPGRRGDATRRRGVAPRMAILALASILLVGAPGGAIEPPPDTGNWDFDLALYGWITDITGQATVGDVTVDVEPQLWNDIIKNLDAAFFSGLEARYQNRWILNTDLFYAKISEDQDKGPFPLSFGPASFDRRLGSVSRDLPVNTPIGDLEIPVTVDPGTLRIDVPRVQTTAGPFEIDTTLTQFMARGLLGYRALDMPLMDLFGGQSDDDPRRFRVDLLGGVRYYRIKTEVSIKSPPIKIPDFQVSSSLSGGRVRVGNRTQNLGRIDLPGAEFGGATIGGTDINEKETTWWVDPLVGVRFSGDVSERVSLILGGNVGGFGIGSASDFSWETALIANYRFGESWSFAAGYRALSFDKSVGGGELDLIVHGPLLGFIYAF